MARWETVGSIVWPSNYGIRDDEGPQFTQCVDGRDPKIREFWDFGEDFVTRKVHP